MLLAAVVTLAAAGCGPGRPAVTDLSVERHSWDSLTVTASFGTQTWWGGTRPVEPDVTRLFLFDSEYDTLFAGTLGGVPVPDRRLADQEALLVEVCGDVAGNHVCEQQGLTASPKRLAADFELEYPQQGDVARGDYRLVLVVERRRFDANSWQRIDPGAVDAVLKAHVVGEEDHAVQVPLQPGSGQFALSREPGFDDFSFELNSRLYDAWQADVHFELSAAINGRTERVASVERSVREKLPSERRQEVAELARAAARHVLDRLTDGESRPRASVYVDDWRFNAITDRYSIALELVWEERRRFFGRRHRLEGELGVDVGGRNAQFSMHGGDREARDRWRARVDGDEMALPHLEIGELLASSQRLHEAAPRPGR